MTLPQPAPSTPPSTNELADILTALGVAYQDVVGWVGGGQVRSFYVTAVGEVTQIYMLTDELFVLWERSADGSVTQVLVVPARRITRVVYNRGADVTASLVLEIEADRSVGEFVFETDAAQHLGPFANDGSQDGQSKARSGGRVALERARYVLAAEEAKVDELRDFARVAVEVVRSAV